MHATTSHISRMVVLASASLLLGFATCAAQVRKVSSDDIMDAALDMRRAAELADKLAPAGARYCRWGISPLEASDLDLAISRFLLNRGTRVPDYVPASKMWRVSFVGRDMVNQLAMGEAECIVDMQYSEDARSISISSFSLLNKLLLARGKFDQLAYQQTEWQEESSSQNQSEVYNRNSPSTGQIARSAVLIAARNLKKSDDDAAKVNESAIKIRGCEVHPDSATKPVEMTYLGKLLDYLERSSHLPGYVPAKNMWGVNSEVLQAQIDILVTLDSCAMNSGGKKQARNKAKDALQAYHQLTTAMAAFDSLALQQTEWEEGNAEKQPAVQEQ